MDLLIVDDSFTMLHSILRALTEGHVPITHVREAGDGANALSALSLHPPNLLITDITMPILDGLKLVRAVRKQFSAARVRIIVVTSKPTQMICSALSAMNVDAIVSKPFAPNDLAAIVNRVMAGAMAAAH